MPGTLLSTEDRVQSLSPLILFLVIGIQYQSRSLGFPYASYGVSTVYLEGGSTPFQFSRSVVSYSVTPWTAAHQAFLSITNTWVLLKFMSIELVMPFNHLSWLWLLGVWECAAGLCLGYQTPCTWRVCLFSLLDSVL